MAKCPLFGCIEGCQPPLSGAERLSLLGGYFCIKCMLKLIGAFVFVRSREVVCFWEGPLREAPLYSLTRSSGMNTKGLTYMSAQ